MSFAVLRTAISILILQYALNNFLPFETSVLWEADPFKIGLRFVQSGVFGRPKIS
jgi:hypothetical protein